MKALRAIAAAAAMHLGLLPLIVGCSSTTWTYVRQGPGIAALACVESLGIASFDPFSCQ